MEDDRNQELMNLLTKAAYLCWFRGGPRHTFGNHHHRHQHWHQHHHRGGGGKDGFGGMFGGFRGHHHMRGFSPSKARVLSLLAESGPMTQKALAEALDIKPASVSELIKKLLQAGLVTREQDASDRRVNHVIITEKGRSFLSEYENIMEDHTEDIFGALSEEEKDALTELLTKIVDTDDKEH